MIIAGIKDKLQALSFASKMDGEEKPTTYDYKGVEVSTTTNNAFAVLDDFIVVAPVPALVEKIIDTEQGAPSLQDQGIEPQFSLDQPFIQAFIPSYANLMTLATAEQGAQGLSPQLQASLSMISNIGYALDFEDNQIQIQGTMDIDPAAISKQQPTMFTSTAIKKLPADTLMMVNMDLSRFNQGWSAMVEASQEIPESKRVFDGIRNLVKRFTGLNLEEDLVNWMDEEFALAIIPSSKPLVPQFPISGNFLVGTSKPAEATKSLTKLDSFIQKSVRPNMVNKSQTKVDGKDITQWDTFQKQTVFSYGWLDKNTLLTSIGDSVGNTAIGKGQSLDQNPKFKELASQFPQKNFGYFYWNLADSVKLIPPAQLQLSTPGQQSFIQSLDAALTTSFFLDDDTIEYNSIITLSPPESQN
ncbi:MAG: DUF3352 domain-containing protein [Synechococcaceae cyanobacterium RL_1_2]|nr:DUF3352 domain-containing protein [Synechococcaceae cyanobacterium RL_1_2]